MWRQMPERCARICLFSPPLLCPHQQIITFAHLQQAVQSPLAGLMATVARESWFRHRPTSWQSNQDLSASFGKVIFPRSLYFKLLFCENVRMSQWPETNLWALCFQTFVSYCLLTWSTLAVKVHSLHWLWNKYRYQSSAVQLWLNLTDSHMCRRTDHRDFEPLVIRDSCICPVCFVFILLLVTRGAQ